MKDVLIKKVSEIKGLEDYDQYLVTSIGEIFSLKSGRKIETKKEYKQVTLHGLDKNNNKVSKCIAIHILVAKAFIENPDNLPEVDHIDRDPYNNRVDNLRWASRKMQMRNTVRTKKNSYKRNVLVLHIDSKQAFTFDSLSEACNQLDLNYSCAYAVMTNKKKSTRGYKIFDAGTSSN